MISFFIFSSSTKIFREKFLYLVILSEALCFVLTKGFFSLVYSTFLSNMKAFGLSNDTCDEFLHKMSTIADLSDGK